MRLRSACGIAALVLVQCQATPPSTASPEPPPSQPAPPAEPPPAELPRPPPAPVAQPRPPPPSHRSDRPAPQFEVRLTQAGITVVRDGHEVGTVATLEELPTILPKHPGDGDIVVRTYPGLDYEVILETTDALRTLGYPTVSFATRRQP